MKAYLYIYTTLLFSLLPFEGRAQTQDSVSFDGQASAWFHYNPSNRLSLQSGIRYIPELNLARTLKGGKLIDMEVSASMSGSLGVHPFDSSRTTGNLKPYRAWIRYSSSMFEFRLGLQKINFGSATMLRPLMWFDQIDPRDPLQLTDGVWGALARYYFLNNANIWVWTLLGNKNLKGWESLHSVKRIPEWGGRIQIPAKAGETALTYHHRLADGSMLPDTALRQEEVTENRIGFDIKLDVVIGLWLEASWSNFGSNLGIFTNQQLLNLGADYTFGLGNGLTVIYEQLLASIGKKAFEFENATTFSLVNLSYPVGMFDHLGAIIYYDWTNKNIYSFLNWQKQFNRISLYVMGYINPKDYQIPAQGNYEMLYGGTGLQVMVVVNH